MMERPHAAQLCRLESRINILLDRMGVPGAIGPPLPTTPEQKDAWTIYRPLKTAPVLPLWAPPDCVPRPRDSGFMLNERTVCYQRGYCPQSVYDELMAVFAEGFHHPVLSLSNGLRDMSFDFIITIEARTKGGTREIAAGCLVELRCAADKAAIPHLYIFELVTKSTYGRHGLAQQMVHAVDTLACLLQHDSETNTESIWRDTLLGRRLFTALTVDRTQADEYVRSLVKLYMRCGLYARRTDTPEFDYRSFTPYSDSEWNPEGRAYHYIAMYKEMPQRIAYRDERVSVAVAIDGDRPKMGGDFCLYYYTIPRDAAEKKLSAIKAKGLITQAHECLHCGEDLTNGMHMVPGCLTFSRQPPAAEDYVFAILADCNGDSTFGLKISIPAWFALFIGKACEIPPAILQ